MFDLDRLAGGRQPPDVNESGLRGASLVGDEMNFAQDVAHDQVAVAIVIPVAGECRCGVPDVDRLARSIANRSSGSEFTFAQAAKPVDLARPGAGEDVERAVMIQIHQLWSEPDASPRRDGADRTARLEPLVALEPRTRLRAQISVDPQAPVVELAHEQVLDAVAINIAIERC